MWWLKQRYLGTGRPCRRPTPYSPCRPFIFRTVTNRPGTGSPVPGFPIIGDFVVVHACVPSCCLMQCLPLPNAMHCMCRCKALSFLLQCFAFSTVKHPILVWYLTNVPLCGKYSPVSLVFVLIFSIFVLYKRTGTISSEMNAIKAIQGESKNVKEYKFKNRQYIYESTFFSTRYE